MIDPARLLAFAAVTAAVSVVPGPNMLFVMAQAAWRGRRGGWLALAGQELGNLGWFAAAGLGLGGVLAAAPLAFKGLTLAGALYLAWLGVQAWRHAGDVGAERQARVSDRPLRDGVVVALSNPKSVIYIAALLPPFLDLRASLGPQLAVLAAVGIAIDVAIGAVYILAGARLAAAMARPGLRAGIERAVGTLFGVIALGVIGSVLG